MHSFVLGLAAAATMFYHCITSGQEQDIQTVEEQPFNIIYTIKFGTRGVPYISSTTEIPADNFRFDPIPEKPIAENAPTKTPSKIHPLLQEWAKRNAPDSVIEVIITLREDQKIPRLPRVTTGESLKSQVNQAIFNARNVRIEKLKQERNKSQTALIQRLQPHGLVVLEQYWLVNSFLARIPIGGLKIVALQPEVIHLQPRFGGEPPPTHDGNPNNDVADARSQIQSDSYFNNLIPISPIAVLDTGVRKSHVMFKKPRRLRAVRDCVNGDSRCKKIRWKTYRPFDDCNHGTSTVGVITGNARLGDDFRGVTANVVDSFKVYNNCYSDSSAVIRAFQAALTMGDDIVVAELQIEEDESGAVATTADNAYDAGAIIVAANGNYGAAESTVRSPAIAHKVIGVGSYYMESGGTPDSQGRGPAADGRIKPDVQAPTDTETASGVSNTALQIFGGTSGSTPYAGAAAALVRDWLLGGAPFDNGQVYAWLINSGQTPFPFNNTEGAGRLKLLVGGAIEVGKTSVSNGGTVYIPFSTSSEDRRIDAAIWWPESVSQQHNDIDIRIFDPSDTEMANSISYSSIFERAGVDGSPLDAGDWKLGIQGAYVPTGAQTVYYVVHHTPFIP